MNFAVILLFCAITYANADHSTVLDDRKFDTLGRYFSGTPSLLVSLATKEEVICMLLRDFQKELRQKQINNTKQRDLPGSYDSQLDLVERYLADYDETSGKVSMDYVKQKSKLRPQQVTWNPLASYHMIRRFSKDVKVLLEGLNLSDAVQIRTYNHILQIMQGLGWPSQEDLTNRMSAILRVQHVYDLNSNELARGKIQDRITNVELRGGDCLAIGEHALATNYSALAIEWLEIAVQKLSSESEHMRQIAETELEQAIMVHDQLWEKAKAWDPHFYVDKVSERRHNRVKRRTAVFDTFKGRKEFNLNEINFWGLCRGENYQDPEEKKKLFCYYESTASNYAWAIRPVKAEILSMNPFIVRYYDIIGDKMIERIKQEAEPSMRRSALVDESGKRPRQVLDIRTSSNTWINDYTKKPFTDLPKIMSSLTRMNVGGWKTSEELQVASHSFGGHFVVHADYFTKPAVNGDGRGQRIATFLFYLSDVEKGGSTAFPFAGVAATPIKGSAIFWYNLFSSGEPDRRTWHGACPVILGEKWVGNKSIRLHEQIHAFKCQPAGRVPYPFEVNGKPLEFEYDETKSV